MSSELVVIDSRLRDSDYVTSQLSQGYTVLLLNDSQDGLTQIVDFLQQQANSGSTTGFSQFIANLQSTKQITQIEVGDIKKQPLVGIQFKIIAFIAAPKKK